MSEFIPLGPLLTALGIMLTLSVIVERVLMLFSWLIDRAFVISRGLGSELIQRQQQNLELLKRAVREEELLTEEGNESRDAREIESNPDEAQPNDQFEILPFEVAAPEKVIKEFWLQKLGFVVAVAGCYYLKFSMWQLFDWLPSVQAGQPHFWEYLLTGIVIGAGSKPVHFLMKFLLNRKVIVSREEVRKAVEAAPVSPQPPREMETGVSAPVKPVSPVVTPLSRFQEIFGFDYDGGYKPERLNYTHLRKRPIDLIVYHHTAMHSEAPYEALIREFERKGWLTGYHSVVFPDGGVRTICRWDRIGNHVRGYNARSLGLAFQGNFEPDPAVPFSNPNGRLGNRFPTSVQLDRAARLVALWVFLYTIPVNFQEHIVPHNRLASKACPGGNFPYQAFEQKIRDYVEAWKNDARVQAVIQEFATYPMVKV